MFRFGNLLRLQLINYYLHFLLNIKSSEDDGIKLCGGVHQAARLETFVWPDSGTVDQTSAPRLLRLEPGFLTQYVALLGYFFKHTINLDIYIYI
jgi:hypothetical protein